MGRRTSLLWLMVVLLLAACSSGSGDGSPAAGDDQPAVVNPTAGQAQAASTPGAAQSPVPGPTPSPSAPLAAVVNGHYVYLADYERDVAQYEKALTQVGVDLATDEGAAQLAQAQQDVIQGLIDEVLIEEGAAGLGVVVTDEELESQVQADIKAGGGQAAFDEWLNSTGQTQEDYREVLRRSVISQRVWDVVAAGVPDEAEQVHARTIALDSQAAADEVVGLIRGGADFVDMVRERSVDVATKENGGDLGWFPRGLVTPELEEVVFNLQPGEISDPIELGEAFHVVQVIEREQARALSEDVKTQLMQVKFDGWLDELRAKAVIERFVGEQ